MRKSKTSTPKVLGQMPDAPLYAGDFGLKFGFIKEGSQKVRLIVLEKI